MRELSNMALIAEMKKVVEKAERKIIEQQNVIDGKDTVIKEQERELNELKGVNSIWNKMEE